MGSQEQLITLPPLLPPSIVVWCVLLLAHWLLLLLLSLLFPFCLSVHFDSIRHPTSFIPSLFFLFWFSSCLSLFHFFQEFDSIEDFSFGGFLDFTGQHEFIQNGIDLVEIKDNIQFTHITEIGIQEFHE